MTAVGAVREGLSEERHWSTSQTRGLSSKELRKEHPSQSLGADRDGNTAQSPLRFTGTEKTQGV